MLKEYGNTWTISSNSLGTFDRTASKNGTGDGCLCVRALKIREGRNAERDEIDRGSGLSPAWHRKNVLLRFIHTSVAHAASLTHLPSSRRFR